VLFHVALVAGIFATLGRTARLAPADPVSLPLFLLVGGLACELRFRTRPELVSYLFLAIVLHLLHRHAQGLPSHLWLLPGIHLVWANVHSLFILGWGAIACFVVGLAIQRRRFERRLVFWSAASFAVAFINPYGLRGVLFPFTLATRLQQENVFAQSIGEFVSPFNLKLSDQFPFYPLVPIFAFRFFFVLSMFALWAAARRKRWWCLLLWLAFAPLAALMIRNMPPLVIACFPATVWGFPAGAILERLHLRERTRRLALAGALAAAAAACVILALRVTNGSYYVSSRRVERFGWGWSASELPIEAARYAKEAGLRGPLFNALSLGGYLMWALPEPVFIDGRLEVVGEEFYMYYQSVLASERAMEECVARYGIRWAMFPTAGYPRLLAFFSHDARWRLAYLDPLVVIFTRAEATPVAAAIMDPRLPDEPEPASPEVLAALPGLHGNPRRCGWRLWLSGLWERTEFPTEDLNLGVFHMYRGDLDRAEAQFAHAILTSGGAFYEPYHDLGAALYRQKRFAEARECYLVVLQEDPGNAVARERISSP